MEKLLLAAVGLCVALMVSGVALAAVEGTGLPRQVIGLGGLPAALVHGQPAAYLTLGLLVLAATPVLRVAASLLIFAVEHDRRYVLVTAAVLVVMGVSVLLGRM